MRYNIEAAVRNHIGRVRKNNEDNFYLNGRFLKREQMDGGGYSADITTDKNQIYAICDGMGGESNGEEASYLTVQRLDRLMETLDSGAAVAQSIDAFCDETNRSILTYGQAGHMGTTVVMAVFHENGCAVAYMGDSRMYLLRDKKLTRLTQDHTEVNRLKDMGLISDEEAKNHPDRSMLHRYLGMQSSELIVTPTYAEYEPQPGDTLLLCSDGLTDMLEDDAIAQILNTSRTVTTATKNLINSALQAGGRDNITVLVLNVRRMEDVPDYAPRHGKVSRIKTHRSSSGEDKTEQAPRERRRGGGRVIILLILLLMLLASGVYVFIRGLGGLTQLFSSKVSLENSTTVVEVTPPPVELPEDAPVLDAEEVEEEPEEEIPEEVQLTPEQSAEALVQEWISYGGGNYLEGSVNGQALFSMALNYAVLREADYPTVHGDRVAVPADAMPTDANLDLWNRILAEGCYTISAAEIDAVIAQYAKASVPVSDWYSNGVLYGDNYLVIPEFDPALAPVAMSDSISTDTQSGVITLSFGVYQGDSRTGDGLAMLRMNESGRYGMQLVALTVTEIPQETPAVQ